MSKRFADWKPVAGEQALVPGGPANKHYVDTLTAAEAELICSGRRHGYLPLEFYVFAGDPKPIEYPAHCKWVNDAWSVWISGAQNKYIGSIGAKDLPAVERLIRKDEWRKLHWLVSKTRDTN